MGRRRTSIVNDKKIAPHIPVIDKSKREDGTFSREDFTFYEEGNVYICPAFNILTTTGLVQRYVTDWAGPDAMVRKIAIRLGVPCYAGDKLTFSGRGEWRGQECVVEVTGRCSLGDHVTGTVHIGRAP